VNVILACIDDSVAARPVLAVAQILAPIFDAEVEALHVTEDGGRTAHAACDAFGVPLRVASGDPAAQLVALAAAPDVVAVVVGARSRPAGAHRTGHLALALAGAVAAPVVAVPPDAQIPDRLHRVLVAMGGTPRDSRSLKRALRLAADPELELVVLHVDDEASIPCFSDQVQHETDAYAEQFLARFAPGAPRARLEMRVGVPVDEILHATETVHPDLLALGWPQSDDPERGCVAREVLDRAQSPCLLVATV
jgi:nucleotide-binding universal stress UspA family protein